MADGLPVQVTPHRLATAYLNVLGPPDKRSVDQQLVWADIEGFCYAYRPVTEKLTTAELDPSSPMLNDGRRTVWLRLRGMIIRALQPAPVPPKISRKKPPTP